jgi:integrase
MRQGKNRKVAARALPPVQADELRGELEVVKGIAFSAWADRWVGALTLRPATVSSYTATMNKAKAVFGSKQVRKLTTEDVHAFIAHVSTTGDGQATKNRPTTTSTRAKHVRVLAICLGSAVRHGYASRNVVALLPPNETPKRRVVEAPYFTDGELVRMLHELRDEGVYRVLVALALTTGARLGELSALRWGDCDLGAKEIRVRRTFTESKIGPPKSGKARTIHITGEAVDLLGEWWGELGRPGDDKLVLPGGTKSGYLNPHTVLDTLYAAMLRAGIPREDANGEKRVFHSLRHSHARVVLEAGVPLALLSRRLGHSSVAITASVYSHISEQAARDHAQALEGAFGL